MRCNINETGCNWPQKWTQRCKHLTLLCARRNQFCGCKRVLPCCATAANALMYVCEWMNDRGRQEREREINFEPPAQLIEMSRKEWLSINHKSQLNRARVPRPAPVWLCLLSETRARCFSYSHRQERRCIMNAMYPKPILCIIWFRQCMCIYFRFWQ